MLLRASDIYIIFEKEGEISIWQALPLEGGGW